MVELRPFARSDREQLTRLANAHVAAVVPGWALPPSALLAQLEREPTEYVVDPWVVERATLVAVERDRLVAAAHLRRYGDDAQVSEDYRDAAEIVWLLCWPDHLEAGRALVAAVAAHLDRWQARVHYADGALPVTYGVSDAWPHVQQLYAEAGFDDGAGHVGVQLAGPLDAIADPGVAPVAGIMARRVVGSLGTAFEAVADGEVVGAFEVDDDLSRAGTMARLAGWADECNHWVRTDLRGRGVGTWLVRHGAAWLRLGGVDRFMVHLIEDEHLDAWRRYYGRFGLVPVNRTRRGWRRVPAGGKGLQERSTLVR